MGPWFQSVSTKCEFLQPPEGELNWPMAELVILANQNPQIRQPRPIGGAVILTNGEKSLCKLIKAGVGQPTPPFQLQTR